MKDAVKTIARAFADVARTTSEDQYPALCTAALALLDKCQSPKSALKRFRKLAERAVYRQTDTMLLTISSPSGTLGEKTKDIVALFEKYSGRRIELIEQKDASLIGGMRIAFDDERIDASLHGNLAQVSAFLCNPLSVSH
ncbi:F0F1 ATP synthase subunit delta [Candidatus Peregrinibacteria bacterium]|nr:F0F1 ATP synthase subunit delta [Candidatus Peregrinibacteria bacterium]